MVRCENGFMILPARPRPRAWKRLITRPLPTWAWATTRSSTSSWWLFSAFAIADSRHLRTSLAMRLRENSRSASAAATFLPRMSWASRLSFCGLTRSILATAFASFSESARGWAFLLLCSPGSRWPARRRAPCLAIGRVAVEGGRRREPPGRDRRAAALGAAAVRVIDRVHGDAAIVRHQALPAIAARLADRDVHVIGVGHRAERRHAAAVHQALLARVQPQDHIVAV